MQSAIHEGYEYQDYFTVSIILQLILRQIDAEIIIDRKAFREDKFDDLKVNTSNGNTEFQIKYSDDEKSHKLTKEDFSNGNGHDTALSDLFVSWKTNKKLKNDTQVKLCLAWNRPNDDDPITEFMKPIQEHSFPFPIVAYSFDGEVFWPREKLPPKNWRKFNLAIKSGLISREDFLSFCKELTIVLEMPKASLDLKNPGDIENVIIRQVEKLGIGIYPNNNIKVEDIVYKLAAEVKHSRAIGNKLRTDIIVKHLGLIVDYGRFDQRFPVDSTHLIILDEEIEKLHRLVLESKHVIITGNPGVGKSWLVNEYINKLIDNDCKVIHYNCFQSLQDMNKINRIKISSLYGNLVSQIIEQCPELLEYKNTVFGADREELENLLCFIEKDIYLVIDGLDHISREYELNKNSISLSETKIISELLDINFPTNCYVIISSQPIDVLDKFKDKNYCVFEVEPWGIEQIKSLMKTFQIDDDIIDDNSSLSISTYLLNKSQGNALYLNYILRQIQNSDVKKESIDKIPDYDTNLSNYYSYLYTQIRNNRTVNALCGADFYLNINELVEITGDGEFVREDISVLHPLLIENIIGGGFSIYHESFRRFVLDLLENKKINLDRNVYGIIADWLKEKPFFEFDKSFYYLTEILYRLRRDNENIDLIDKEFVIKSVAEGYSREYIKINLNYIIRSAGRSQNLIKLVTAGELLAMLDDMNDFESTGEEYLQAICDTKGPQKLNNLMQIDGKPTFDKNIGLLACYISSKAGNKPWWNLYLDTETKVWTIENFKYYFRYNLDEYGVSIIPRLMERIEKGNISIRNQWIKIAYDELKDYIEFNKIVLIAEKKRLINWKNYLSYIETGYYQKQDVSFDDVIRTWKKIKKINSVTEDNVWIFVELFSQVHFISKNTNNKAVELVLNDYENSNWFHNWIIYSVKMAELYAQKSNMDSKIICESTITNLKLLLQDTDVFKGTPRACDLFYLKNELANSYNLALKLIIQYGTLEDLNKALSILEKLGDETRTSFMHMMTGPLTDAEFLKLIASLLTTDNYKIVKPYLLRIQEKIENNEVYDCIAAAKLRFVSLISKYSKSEALEYFDFCIPYLVAYGFHKDNILEQIVDSYNVFFESVGKNIDEERDTITKMTMALLYHTDGKGTNHFLNYWFDKLLETDSQYALGFLYECQLRYGKSWIVEGMLRSVIKKYCKNFDYLDIVIGLIKSLPNDTSPIIINAAANAFKTLAHAYIENGNGERLRIKHSMNELVINIVSRFNILDEPWSENNSWKDESIKEFLLTVESAGFDVSQYIEYFKIKKANNSEEGHEETFVDVLESRQTHFFASDLTEAKKWFESNILIERDIQSICEFLRTYQNDKDTLLEILRVIISKNGWWRYSQESKSNILAIIRNIDLDDKELAEVHMLMYLYSYENGSSLTDKDEFSNSIKYDGYVAWKTFWNELPRVIISHSGKITKGLLNTFFTIGFDNNSIVMIWENAFDIMKLRFPNIDQYTINNIFKENNEQLGLRNCLLLRFIDGGRESFLATYAYIADAAEKENYSEFTESIVFCIKNYKYYNLVTQIAVADLVRCYGDRLNESNLKQIINAINTVYPTGNLLIDVIFSNFTIYRSFLITCSDKHMPNCMEPDYLGFYLLEKLYDLGEIDDLYEYDEYANNSIYRDNIMQVVNDCGINYAELYKQLHTSRILKDKILDFLSGGSNIPEMNTIYKSYVIQYALHAIIKKVFCIKMPEIIFQNLLRLVPDYQRMYKLFKCRQIQPKNHLYNQSNSCESLIKNSDSEYLLVGCFEKRKYINYKKLSLVLSYKGLVYFDDGEDNIPFNKCFATDFGLAVCDDNPTLLIDLISTVDCELENENYLLPNMSVLKMFNIHIEFDFWNDRYIAINQDNDIVFMMKKWLSSYKGDNEHRGNAIPLYSGTALYIKKKYIEVLEQKYGNLMMKTVVKSLTY